jgi:hypothetical protein
MEEKDPIHCRGEEVQEVLNKTRRQGRSMSDKWCPWSENQVLHLTESDCDSSRLRNTSCGARVGLYSDSVNVVCVQLVTEEVYPAKQSEGWGEREVVSRQELPEVA